MGKHTKFSSKNTIARFGRRAGAAAPHPAAMAPLCDAKPDEAPSFELQRSYSEEAGLPVDILREALTLTGREPSAKSQVLSSAQRVWNSRQSEAPRDVVTEDATAKSALQTLQRSYSALCADEASVPIGIMKEVLAEEGRDETSRAKVMSAAQHIWKSKVRSAAQRICRKAVPVVPTLQRSYSELCADEAGVPIGIMKQVLTKEGRDESAKPRVLSAAQRIWKGLCPSRNQQGAEETLITRPVSQSPVKCSHGLGIGKDWGAFAVPAAGLSMHVSTATITNVDLENPFSKPNQDRLLVESCLNGYPGHHLFSVFDGHGKEGHHCAQFVQERLVDALCASEHLSSNVTEAYTTAFDQINKAMHKDRSVRDMESGTTAVTVMVRDGELQVANIGDSRAILVQCSGEDETKWTAVELTHDHTPFRHDELERVRCCGAQVATSDEINGYVGAMHPSEWKSDDPPRCFVPNVGAPGTGFTRSIGDTMAETIGVNAVPEVMQHSITGKDRAFIVCSDGITEHLSSQEVVDILAEHQDDLLAGAELLAAKAKDLWLDSDTYTDDITVIVVKLVQAEGWVAEAC